MYKIVGVSLQRLLNKYSLILVFISFFLCSSHAQSLKIVVSKDGSGNYKTVQEALDQIPVNNKVATIVYIKNGIYKERLILDTRKDFVQLIGEDKAKTILTYDNHKGSISPTGDTVNTWSSASFFIYGNNFHAENITFQNNAGFSAGQAVALFVFGTRASFTNCNMIGFQDVLFCSGQGTVQYYKDCYIEGTTDFIFGAATAVFKNCHIHSKKNSHVTAASTPREMAYGFVFFDCALTADSGVNKVSLGRPWQPYSCVTYIHCKLGDHIVPEGWNNWKNPDNEKTARYAEFENTGPGASPSTRFSWSKQLTKEEADKYTIGNILGGWDPEK